MVIQLFFLATLGERALGFTEDATVMEENGEVADVGEKLEAGENEKTVDGEENSDDAKEDDVNNKGEGKEPSGEEGERESPLKMTMVMQTGGYVGLGALGLGLEYGGVARTELMGGFTPSNIEGVDDLRQLAIKNTVGWRLDTLGMEMGPYFGFSVIYLHGDEDVFVSTPKKYPKNYYPPTALRAAPILGVEMFISGLGIFYEVTSLDTYLETFIRSKGGMEVSEIATHAFGLRLWAW